MPHNKPDVDGKNSSQPDQPEKETVEALKAKFQALAKDSRQMRGVPDDAIPDHEDRYKGLL